MENYNLEGANMSWNDFWFGAKALPFWAFSIRAAILYICLIIATRFMRQRQISILSGHNYLVAAGIVSLAAVRMVNPESSLIAAIAIIFVYAGFNILLSYLDLKFPRQIDRHSTVVAENGHIIKKNLKDTRITIDNLMGQLRLKDVFNISDVVLALVEPTGKVNVIKKTDALPITKKQMNILPSNVSLPVILIYNGEIQNETLKSLGYDSKWLIDKIKENGVLDIKNIFVAILESDGNINISI